MPEDLSPREADPPAPPAAHTSGLEDAGGPGTDDPCEAAAASAPRREDVGPPSSGEVEPPAAEDADEDEVAEDDLEDGGGEEGDEGGDETSPPRARTRRKTPRTFAPVPPERLVGALEALLVASGDVLSVERLRDLLGLQSVIHVREGLEELGRRWGAAGSSVELQEIAGGYRATTRPEYAEYVRRLARRPASDRLSPSLMETLSIVAYRQPVPRVEVERIRGVQAGDALRALLERRLLKVVGRSDQPGRPLLYGTTRRFLEVFGLASLKDLPKEGELKRL